MTSQETDRAGGDDGADDRCAHCNLPVDARGGPVSDGDAVFCCVGCRAVYHAIRRADLDGFYEMRDPEAAAQVPPEVDGGDRAEFDTEPFLEQHTTANDDGTRTVEFHLQGVHCAGCVWLVEKMPGRVGGVVDARLNLARARLTVRWKPEVVELSEIAAWLEQFGYVPQPTSGEAAARENSAEKALLRRVGVAWALAANVMLLAFALYAGLDAGAKAGLYTAFRWLSLVLTTGSVAYGGATFFRRAWGSIRPLIAEPSTFDPRRLSIDIPISLGILGGYLHSAWATVTGTGEVWFDSVAVLIAALLTARWLQVRGQSLARASADRLFQLLPTGARRVLEGAEAGDETEMVAADEIAPGETVEVHDSEKVPVDGRVVAGATNLELSTLTGESRPEHVEAGDRVFAGATNLGDPIRIAAESTAENSRVGQLRDWIEEAGEVASPVVERADRWAGYFVLAVLVAAAVVWTGWTLAGSEAAMRHTIALLVISCPCALGMATPLAMTIGVGRAARRGMFVRDDAVFEKLRQLGELVVDKTGTVTRGEMSLLECRGEVEALERAAVLERESRHPVGRALHRWGGGDWELRDVEHLPGSGITGAVGDRRVAVGRPDWLVERTGEMRESFEMFVDEAAESGHTPVAVAVDGEIAAVAALGDPIRPRAGDFIEHLRGAGVEITMLSGDHPSVVRSVADDLAIPADAAHGHVGPEQKAEYIREQREARSADDRPLVGMLGDGVNDAAAMKMADVGIAVDGSANPSVVAADVFVARDGMEPLFELWTGADGVLKTVKRNVGMSIAYNTVGVTAAAAGLVSPLAAAVAMPLSSIAVVLSSVLQSAFDEDPAEGPATSPPSSPAEPAASPSPTPTAR